MISRFASLALILSAVVALSRVAFAAAGNDNPGGVTAEYNGSVLTAGHYDPYTGNASREIDDVVVAGSVGVYPLKFTRILHTRGAGWLHNFGEGGGWSHSYDWSLWVRPLDENDGHGDGQYNGPLGGIAYPNGGTFDLLSDGPPWAIAANGPHGPADILVDCTLDVCVPGATYELRRGDGGKVLFQPAPAATTYRAYAIIDPYGQPTTLAYDASGRLWRVTEPAGRYLEFSYQVFSYFDTVTSTTVYTDAIGAVTANDGRGNVVETVSYQYDSVWLTGAFSRQVQYLRHAYYDDDAAGNYTYSDSNSYTTPNTQAAAGIVQSCDDPRYAGPMKQIQYEYVPWTEVPDAGRGQIKAEKNVYGQVVSSTTYPTAANPNLLQRTETRGDGPSRVLNYPMSSGSFVWTDFKSHSFTDTTSNTFYGWTITDARQNTTTYEREPVLGALRKITHPGDGTTREFTFSDPYKPYYHSGEKDENGNWTSFDRDPTSHQVTQIHYPDQSTEEFTYNGFGQVLTHKLRSGGTETFTYDGRGLKQTSYPPATESDPAPWDHPTTYYYYTSGPNTDQIYMVVDPRSNATAYEYNQRGQVTKVQHQDGTYTQSAYNIDGTLAWTADENHPGAATDPNQRTRYTYDEYKRALTVTNPMNETTTSYYGLDWANPLLHTSNSVKYTLSPMGKNVVFDYDENFRKKDQVVALGTADEAWTWFDYDEVGNLNWTRDSRWNVTTFGYDARNRKISVDDPISTDRNISGHTMNWQYDGVGNKRYETRADNLTQEWRYDSVNRLTEHYGFAGERIVRFDRNTEHTWEWITDAKGATYAISFDALHRKVFEHYPPDATRADPGEHLWYDAVGNLIQYKSPADDFKHFSYDNRNRERDSSWDSNGPSIHKDFDAAGRLTSITTYSGETTVTFGYDDANRQISEEQTLSGYPTRQINTPRDADGNRTGLGQPDGSYQIYFDYTQRNQLATIYGGVNSPLIKFTYDASGNLLKREGQYIFNFTSFQYDELNRVSLCQQAGAYGGVFETSQYQYDALGREVATWRDEAGYPSGKGERFGYTATNQLAVAQYNADQVWTGNAVNAQRAVSYNYSSDTLNRTSMNDNGSVTSYTASAMNQYAVNGAVYNYDGNFNLREAPNWGGDFDAQSQLRSAGHDGNVGFFTYDGLGRCVRRTVYAPDSSSKTVLYTYDGWSPIVERDGAGNLIAHNVYGAKTDQILFRYWFAGIGELWYHLDGKNNVEALLGGAGNGLEKVKYDAFGRPTVIGFWDHNVRPQSAYKNRFMFQGREWIGELGIYDYRHRMYNPDLGRFLQTDPTGFDAGDMNLFRYCDDDPVDLSDPTGLDSFSAEIELRPDLNNIPNISTRGFGGTAGFLSITTEVVDGKIFVRSVDIRATSYVRTRMKANWGEYVRSKVDIKRTITHEAKVHLPHHEGYYTDTKDTIRKDFQDGRSYGKGEVDGVIAAKKEKWENNYRDTYLDKGDKAHRGHLPEWDTSTSGNVETASGKTGPKEDPAAALDAAVKTLLPLNK
jgi:RHS repeat-associated protein